MILEADARATASPRTDSAEQIAVLPPEASRPRKRGFESCWPAMSPSSSPSAEAPTARIWRGRPPACLVSPRSASPPTAPAIPIAIASSRSTVAREFGLRHEIIQTSELDRAEYRANPTNRCYYCKHELYTALSAHRRASADLPCVADGSNADDRGDYRPGRQAAREFGVRSPLDEVGLTKAEIRELSRRAGLRTWDEPASACLSSRIPYHSEVTREKLRAIERAEDVLRVAGVSRVPGPSSRTRQPEGRRRSPARWRGSKSPATNWSARSIPTFRAQIVRELRQIGYQHVTIDLQGYRMGSLNEGFRLDP